MHITSDDLKIMYGGDNNPKGIRDRSGYLFFFREIIKYQGQDERYKQDCDQIHRLADFLLDQLKSELNTQNKLNAAKADCKCLGCDQDRDETQPDIEVGGELHECGSCGWMFCEARMSQIDDPDVLNNTCISCDNYEAV